MIASIIAEIKEMPRLNSVVGTIAGWASFDLLRASQISAALLAGLVSICSLILILPKVVEGTPMFLTAIKIIFRIKK